MSHSDRNEDPAFFHGDTQALTALIDSVVTELDWLLQQHKDELQRMRRHEQAYAVEQRQVRLDHLLGAWTGSLP